MAKEGSTISGLMDSFALAISMLLQHNIELKDLVNKFAHLRFEPSGLTRNPEVPIAKSIIDYIFRWLAIQFLPRETSEEVIKPQKHLGDIEQFDDDELPQKLTPSKKLDKFFTKMEQSENEVYTAQSDAPPCSECGSIMTRSGSCYRCLECGSTSGCS